MVGPQIPTITNLIIDAIINGNKSTIQDLYEFIEAVESSTDNFKRIEAMYKLKLKQLLAKRQKKGKKAGLYTSPLTGRTVVVSESGFGLSGAGKNRELLEKYGSEEAKNATGEE